MSLTESLVQHVRQKSIGRDDLEAAALIVLDTIACAVGGTQTPQGRIHLDWAKSRGTLGRSHFMWAHEPAFYGWPKGNMPAKPRRPEPGCTTVWQIDQAGESSENHPTQKPVELFARPIQYHTLPGDVCLEPFSGSGTQIIAAARLGRACSAMEKSPAFVDVAVRRWELATGKQAMLDGTEKTFEDIANERSSS